MIQVNRIYLIFNRLVTKKFLVDTSGIKCNLTKIYFIIYLIEIYSYERESLSVLSDDFRESTVGDISSISSSHGIPST